MSFDNSSEDPTRGAGIKSSNTEYSHKVNQEIDSDIDSIAETLLPTSEYLSYITDPETNETVPVVDIEALKANLEPDQDGHRFRYKGKRVAIQKIAKALFNRHAGMECISKDDLESGNYIPKPLFYYPESVQKATHRLSIREAEYHLTLWDLVSENAIKIRDEYYPTMDGTPLGMLEAKTGVLLFHDFDAQRDDETGKLFLKNPDYNPRDKTSKKNVPVSRDVIRQIGLRQLIELQGEKSRSIREGLTNDCPNLLASGALRLDDFREITLTSDGETIHNFSPKKIGSNGYVMIHGVNHYVGRRFAGALACPFDGDSALVMENIDGQEVFRGMFSLVAQEDASEVYVDPKTGNSVARANAPKTNLQELSYDKFANPESGEVLSEQQRLEASAKVTLAVQSLINIANDAEQLIVDEVGETKPEFTADIRRAMLMDAKRVLSSVSQANDSQALERILNGNSAEARTFLALLQKLGVEKMSKKPLEKVATSQLTEEDREQMRHLIYENYQRDYPGEDNSVFRETVIKSFEDALKRETNEFYILRDGSKVVSFNRFENISDPASERTVLYFGSFNAEEKYRGVGGFMLEQTIQDKLKSCDVMQAHCDPKSDISKKYIEDGFIATQALTLAGKYSFEIWRSSTSQEQLTTKQMDTQELVALAGKSMDPAVDYFVREVELNDEFIELDSGLSFLLTRYFVYGDKTYVAFELNPELSKQFVSEALSKTSK